MSESEKIIPKIDFWAELQKCQAIRGRMAEELEILQARYKDLQINNRGTHSKLKNALFAVERFRIENDRLRDKIRRYEAIIIKHGR